MTSEARCRAGDGSHGSFKASLSVSPAAAGFTRFWSRSWSRSCQPHGKGWNMFQPHYGRRHFFAAVCQAGVSVGWYRSPGWLSVRGTPGGSCSGSRPENHDVVTVHEVNQPVFFADPPGPGTGEGMAERLGLPIPVHVSRNTSSMSRLIRLSIARRSRPSAGNRPATRGEDDPHCEPVCSSRSPRWASATARRHIPGARRWLALA